MPNKIAEWLIAEHERWMLWLPVAVGVGIAAYFQLPIEPGGPALAALGLGSAAALLILRRLRLPLVLLIGLAAAIIGFYASVWQTERMAAPKLYAPLSIRPISGQVDEVIRLEQGSKLMLVHVTIDRVAPEDTPKKISVSYKKKPVEVKAGDWVSLKGGLFPPPSPSIPGAFDFSRYFYFRGIGAVGFGVTPPEIIPPPAAIAVHSRSHAVEALRAHISNRFHDGMASPNGAVAAAFITGDTKPITGQVYETMRASGLTHLLAVSGMNLALVAGILFFSIRLILAAIPPLALRFHIKKWAAVLALAGTYGYLLIAASPVSAERAFVMVGLMLVAVMLDREVTPMRSLAWSAVLLLLVEPESMLGAGFQLSFAATIALVAFYEQFRDRFHDALAGRRALYFIAGAFFSSLIAGIATAPFTLYHFSNFSSYSLLANMLVAPIVTFVIMPMAVLAMALMPLGIEQIAFIPMEWGVKIMLACAGWVASLPESMMSVRPPTVWGLALVALGGLWLCLWQRRWRLAGTPFIVIGVASLFTVTPPDIVVEGSGKHIAVRSDAGRMVLLKGRPSSFGLDSWLQRAGEKEFVVLKDALKEGTLPPGLQCDKQGCVFTAHGRKAALLWDRNAHFEDCPSADLVVVTEIYLDRAACPAPSMLIDREQLKNFGAHAIWLNPMRVENIAGAQGRRAWSSTVSEEED